ncbi:metallophosphoesterase [Myxococcota bacterium]|nr:metallophosphoesterase [Myxococcota bacterium]MBU1381930.1 metallophosphoesterase [Myxococcota bacterium]MBU1497831.1 metallophosphoesterase [Myxococcota bacterium]
MPLYKYIIFITISTLVYGIFVYYLGSRTIGLLPLKPRIKKLLWLLLLCLLFIIWILRRFDRFYRYDHIEVFMTAFYTFMIFLLFIAFLSFIRDFLLILWKTINFITEKLFQRKIFPARKINTLLPTSVYIIFFLSILWLVTGLIQAFSTPHLKKVEIIDSRLPEEFSGLKIILISDMHIGPTLKRSSVEKIVRVINSIDHDFVVIAGDMVDGPINKVFPHLKPLMKLKKPVFFSPGNHELYWNFSSWGHRLESLGINVLTESFKSFEKSGKKLVLAGITDEFRWSGGKTKRTRNPVRALVGSGLSDYRILIAHRPSVSDDAKKADYNLMLSGHTHGGQFFPLTILTYFFPSLGHGLTKSGNLLVYTTSGAGFWGPPIRFLNPPEIVLITLKSSKDK